MIVKCLDEDGLTLSSDVHENPSFGEFIALTLFKHGSERDCIYLSKDDALKMGEELIALAGPTKDQIIKDLNLKIREIESLRGRHLKSTDKLDLIFRIAGRKAND